MRATSRIVVAVGSGYLLGRTKKLRFAVIVGGAVTGRQVPTSIADLLRMGWRAVDASPELFRLKAVVRDQLLVAGRAAAVAAAGHHMEILTDRLTVRLELLEAAPGPETVSSPESTNVVTTLDGASDAPRVVEPIMIAGEPVAVDERLSLPAANGHTGEGATS